VTKTFISKKNLYEISYYKLERTLRTDMHTEKAKPKLSGIFSMNGLPDGYTVNIFELSQSGFNVRGMLELSHEGKEKNYSVEGDNFITDVKLSFTSPDGNEFSFDGMFDDDGRLKGFLNGELIGDVVIQKAS
jgi:hypothetical protein